MEDTAKLDKLNIGLMLAALGVAYLIPFQLLLLSYAFLGPAHYLTQISWMHDRNYFTKSQTGPWVLMMLTFLTAAVPALSTVTLGAALAVALMMVIISERPYIKGYRSERFFVQALLVLSLYVAYDFAQFFSGTFRTMVVLAMPTTMHIYVFTGAFMLAGALKRPGPAAYAALAFFIACPVLLFALPPMERMSFENGLTGGFAFFKEQFGMLMKALGVPNTPVGHASLFGFLSWAYTYHYLNWFSKTKLIGWHEISKRRAGVIIALYAAAVGLYLYDFSLGFNALLALSLLHVLLELPLDIRTIYGIGAHIRAKLA